MLKAKYRGISRKNVERTQRKGRVFGNGLFKIWTLSKKEGSVQFALIISKKLSKKATERNKLRRRIYEIIGTNYTGWENQATIVISAKHACMDVGVDELKKHLMQLLR